MKKFVKVLGISLLVILIVAIILFAVGYIIIKNYMETIKAVVVKVNDNSMLVMGITDNLSGLMSVGFTDEGNIGYKQGQEISFKYNGSITDMYPPSLDKVDKIKITKEKSDVEIPESVKIIKQYALIYSIAESIQLPKEVTKIEGNILNSSSIKKLEINSKIEEISTNAFINANNLNEIIIHKKNDGTLTGSPWGCVYGDRAIIWDE